MGQHRKSNHDARKKKYSAQFERTAKNKAKHIEKLKKENPNWPNKKDKEK